MNNHVKKRDISYTRENKMLLNRFIEGNSNVTHSLFLYVHSQYNELTVVLLLLFTAAQNYNMFNLCTDIYVRIGCNATMSRVTYTCNVWSRVFVFKQLIYTKTDILSTCIRLIVSHVHANIVFAKHNLPVHDVKA